METDKPEPEPEPEVDASIGKVCVLSILWVFPFIQNLQKLNFTVGPGTFLENNPDSRFSVQCMHGVCIVLSHFCRSILLQFSISSNAKCVLRERSY